MAGKAQSNVTEKRPAFWRSRIGRRLLLAILCFSSLITLVVTGLDLYLEYRDGVATIRERLKQVEISYAASLGESLWKLDKRQIALQLRGIAELPDIRSVELHEHNAAVPIRFSVSVEDDGDGPGDSRDIPVWCNCGGTLRTIGVLRVEATHANLYRDIFRRAEVILAGQAVKTFLVATFILFVVHRMVTRHLLNLAGAIAGFTPGETARLTLRRPRPRHPDEFDEVVDTFNAMRERLERRSADLRAADARMQAILDNIPDPVWFKDAEGRFIAGNRPLAKLLGVEAPAALVGRCDEDFSPPDLARAYREDDAEVMRTRAAKRLEELHVRHENGSRFLIETVKTPLFDGAGAVIGTVGIARDISERRAMEEELRETATRLEALIANLKATVFRSTYSADGPRLSVSFYGVREESGRAVVAATPLALSTFRKSLHPEDQLRELETIGREFAESGYVNRPCRLAEADGSTRWYMVRERVVGRDGDVITTEGLSVDVSEEMETRRMLEAVIANLPGSVFRLKYEADGNKRRLFMQGGSFYRRPVEMDTVIPPELYHPDDRHALFVEVRRRLMEEGTAVHTFRSLHHDGTYRWLRAWERVVERRGDEMVTEGIALDVTHEMEVKEAYEESQRRFREFVDALPVGAFEDDLGKGCVYASSLWMQLTGLAYEDILGSGWMRAVHPDDLPQVTARWRQSVADRAVFQSEYRLRHLDGHVTWVMVHAVPRLSPDGSLRGYIGSITDISDRKVYERSLEHLNHVLRTVTAGNEAMVQAPDKAALFQSVCQVVVKVGGYGLAWVGLAEDDDSRSVRIMACAGKDADYAAGLEVRWDDSPLGCGPTGAAIRTGLPQMSHDLATDPCMAPWRDEALRHGFRSTISLPLKAEAGVMGCLNIYSGEVGGFSDEEARILLDFANNIAFTVVALRERRLRAEMERHLQQAQKMEALGLLAGSVAHDFNNLLGAIQGFASFIVEDSPEGDSASYYGKRILMAGKRGKALIGQILSFSRQLDVKRDVFPAADLIAETLALLEATLPASTQLTVNADLGAATITGDRDLLGQALINLCMNAADALGDGPGIVSIMAHVHPSADEVTARLPAPLGVEPVVWQNAEGLACAAAGSLDPSHPCVSLVVSDSGCGMDKAVLGRIFVPFFTTKKKGHGTGLGLAAVQRTVLAHQGLIVVESRPGSGTSFEIVLPCDNAGAALPAADRPAQPQPAVAGGRILLVDDDSDFGDMLLTALERRGYDVSPCSDPLEALAGLREFPGAWDAMVTDQSMPDMSGLELIRAAKALQPDLVCILCTGYAEDALDDTTLAEAGAVALFRKPVDVDELVGRLPQQAGRRPDTV